MPRHMDGDPGTRRNIGAWLDYGLYDRIRDQAHTERRPISHVIADALELYLAGTAGKLGARMTSPARVAERMRGDASRER